VRNALIKPKYRAALFDLDDTLFDHQAHRREALAAVACHVPALCRVDVRALEAAHDVHLQRTHVAVLSGTLSIAEARTQRMRGFLGDYGVNADAALADACEKIYREAYDRDWRTVPGARELLQALRERGVWIGVITNGLWSEQTAKVRKLGLESVLNDLIVSEVVGSKKPAREFFNHAVARTGCRPSECIVIGDLWETDIEGAMNYEMNAIWLNRYERAFETRPGVVEVKSLLPTEAMLRLFLDEEAERHGRPIDEAAAP
jgi:putative hydrolase of the HAD superfamily